MGFLFNLGDFSRERRLSLALSGLYLFTLSLSSLLFQFTFGTLPSRYREPDKLSDFV